MREIQSDPEKFTFPNFCFEKKFKYYLFLDSGILASGTEAQAYFFRILKALEVNTPTYSSEDLIWELLIPHTFEWRGSKWKGERWEWEISKELKRTSLFELEQYFISFLNGNFNSHPIQLIPEFWIGLKNILCVYAEYNAEIIVIGTDLHYKIEELKEVYTLPGAEIRNITIDGKHPYIKERRVDFFYDSFEEYIDHWGPILRWDKQKIKLLKTEFLK
jgi:hypothetical protein